MWRDTQRNQKKIVKRRRRILRTGVCYKRRHDERQELRSQKGEKLDDAKHQKWKKYFGTERMIGCNRRGWMESKRTSISSGRSLSRRRGEMKNESIFTRKNYYDNVINASCDFFAVYSTRPKWKILMFEDFAKSKWWQGRQYFWNLQYSSIEKVV